MSVHPHPFGHRLRNLIAAMILSVGAVLAATPVPQAAAQAAPAAGAPPLPEQRPPARGVASPVKPRAADPAWQAALAAPAAPVWPAGGTAEVPAGPGRKAAAQRVGGLPVAVEAPGSGAGTAVSASTAGRVRVRVHDRAASLRAGLSGPVVSVQPTDPAAPARPVTIRLGYADFGSAYGGDWGARLRLVALPACVLTTPQIAACRVATPVPSTNDAEARTVTGRVTAGGGDPAGLLLALEAEDGSAQGTYAATKLNASSSWGVALGTGGFSWSYPLRPPPVPGGLSPQISLAYSTQTVDGRTAATNNQGSWVGEGFSYEPGYIERRYRPCVDDGHTGVGDLCWARHNATVLLAGRSGELVKINDNTWKLSNDDGSKVERLTGASNGDNDGEYWKLTTTDGTQYFFGRNQLPGWTGAAGQSETQSTWTLPVYGDDSGEPCYNATFANAHCTQAWRWNLDYVIDPHNNVISYYYQPETNYYARGARFDINGTAYHRGGYLKRVDYGQRDGQVYAGNAPARVQFTVAERCLPGGGVDCDPEDLTASTAASWPDVPFDLNCDAGTHCKNTQASPTFWTRKRLTKVTTEIRSATSWTPVESWTLEHDFTNNGDASRTLWLSRIIHAGLVGGTVTLPSVDLVGIQMPNRIDVPGDNISELIRYRLKTVYTESGAQIDVNYAPADCVAGSLPTPGSSTKRCFPVRWNPLGAEDPITDWFHKYVVGEIIQTDRVGGNPDSVTRYEYVGETGWRKTKPDGITKTEDLSWADWRGYGTVVVRTGDGQAMPTRVDHTFLRGLHGDPLPGGGTRTATVTDSTGTIHTDHDELSGHELEAVTYNGTAVVNRTISTPWRQITHTQSESWGSRSSALVRTLSKHTLTQLEPDAQGNPRWRQTKLVNSHDPTWGRITQVDDLGDIAPGATADDKCTRVTYADNVGRHMYSYISRTETVTVHCGVTDPDRRTQLLSDTRTAYDLQAHGVAPTTGDITRTDGLKNHDGTSATLVGASETTVDMYGRALAVKDALGNVTTTSYLDTNGLNTQTTVTNPLGHRTITNLHPAFGLTTSVIDPNDKRTDLEYDPLGRLIGVWQPNRSKASGQTPNVRYGYRVETDKPVVVTTEKLRNDGTYRATYQLYDGLLRPRQAQSAGPGGGWLLTDTFHNGTGAVAKTNAAYLALGTPGDRPIVVPEGSTNAQTAFVYDGAGRQTHQIFLVAGDERSRTSTGYGGDRVHVDPPDGGTPTTTVSDARGNPTELHQYVGTSPSGPADVTRYTHTPAGSIATITDPAGNTWRYTYNQRNQKIKAEDPDSGTSTYGYDDLGRLTSSTDARGVTLLHVYDKLSRKTQTWHDLPGTDVKLAEWSYDGLAKGHLHWSARYVNGKTYGITRSNLDAFYRPQKTSYFVPSDAGTELARTYDLTTAYNLDSTVQSIGLPAAGGLAAEAVVFGYDNLLRPTTLTGTGSYVTSTDYADTGELLRMELYAGGSTKKVWRTWTYERGTGRILTARLDRQDAAAVDADAHYSYDDAGGITAIADTPAGGPRDIQCFSHDHLRRLTEAWSTASTASDPCAGGPAVSGVGGPAPYHESWTFDAVGNRRSETLHSTTGGADTVRDYTYPAAGGAQPHTLRQVDESGPAGTKAYTYGYDQAGNTTGRNLAGDNHTLTWDLEGHLATSTSGGQTTSFVYDADGNRLVRKEPNATTLYLPGMELRLDLATRQVTGTRSYSFGGRTVAVRTGAGVRFQADDHHGTASASIDATTGAITWRRTTPYGAIRGTPPGSWPDQKGFVGGTADPTSRLTHLGAREYDPSIGRFISLDPVIDHNDPQQLEGYSYANNSPVIGSDPDGLRPCLEECGSKEDRDWWAAAQHSLRHNAAVRAAATVIRLRVAEMGGDPANVKTEFYIPGASKNGTGRHGFADIVYIDGNTIYVWEVKSVGEGAAKAASEVQHYISHLQKQGYKAQPGFAMNMIGIDYVKGSTSGGGTAEFAIAHDGGLPGAILYESVTIRRPPPGQVPVEEPRRVPVPAPTPGPQPIPGRVPAAQPQPTHATPGTPEPTPCPAGNYWVCNSNPYNVPPCQGWRCLLVPELAPLAVFAVVGLVVLAPEAAAALAVGGGIAAVANA